MIQLNQRPSILPFGAPVHPPYASTNNTTQWALLLPPHLTIEGVGRVTTLILVCNSWCSKSPKSTTKQPPSSHSPILPQLDLLYPPPVQQWVHHPPVWSLRVQQRTVWAFYPSTCKASLVKGELLLQPSSGLICDRHRREAIRRKKVSDHTATVGDHEQNHHVSTPYPHTTVSTSCPPSTDICPPPVMTFVSLFFFPATHRVVVPAISTIVYYNTVMKMTHSSAKCVLRVESNWSAKCWAVPTKAITIGVIDFKEAVNRNDFDMPRRKLHILAEWSHQLKDCKTTYIGRVESSWRRNSNYCCT